MITHKLVAITHKWVVITHKWVVITHKWSVVAHKWCLVTHKWSVITHKWVVVLICPSWPHLASIIQSTDMCVCVQHYTRSWLLIIIIKLNGYLTAGFSAPNTSQNDNRSSMWFREILSSMTRPYGDFNTIVIP